MQMTEKEVLKLRTLFPVTKSKVFLNHSAYSPLSQPVLDIMHQYNEDLSRFDLDEEKYSLGKEVFADLIHAKKEEIAMVQNTSMGMNIAANMLEYPQGANIVTTDLEYPSVVYPWLKPGLGVEVRYVENVDGIILSEHVEEKVDDNTVAVAVSHVEYMNGFRNDLRVLGDIAHEHGALLIVDAIQSLGVIDVDVRKEGVDFLTASCYKWLLGPAGVGYLYVREELVKKFEPTFIGWASVKPEVFETIGFWDIWKLQLSETASRFEVGCPSFISLVGAAVAIQLLMKTGIPRIEERILNLTDYLIEKVEELGLTVTTPKERKYRSGIVHFLIDGAEEKAEALKNEGIIVSPRSYGLRVAPHFYNTKEEVERLLSKLEAL